MACLEAGTSVGRFTSRNRNILDQDDRLEFDEPGVYANVISLGLDDLVPDETGSIVIQTDGDTLSILLSGYEEVLKRGIAADGTRSEHFDVSGLDFIKFLNGTTLYFAADEVHVTLGPEKYPTPQRSDPARSLSSLIDRELRGKPYKA